MHIRIVRLEADPSRRDQHLQEWTTKVLPALKTQPGYKGVTLLQKRETGEIISGSYFESEQAMKDAGGNVLPIAQKMLETTGGKIVSNDEYEVAVFERLQPVEAGNWVRLTTIEGDASRIEDGVSGFKTSVLPVLQQQAGNRSALLFINRATGSTLAASGWNTREDLDRSLAAITAPRDETIKAFGGHDPKVEVFEVALAEVVAPAAVG